LVHYLPHLAAFFFSFGQATVFIIVIVAVFAVYHPLLTPVAQKTMKKYASGWTSAGAIIRMRAICQKSNRQAGLH